jgi:hypothetical protein
MKPAVHGRPPEAKKVCPDEGETEGPQDEEGLELCQIENQIKERNKAADEVNNLTSRLERWKQHPPPPFPIPSVLR